MAAEEIAKKELVGNEGIVILDMVRRLKRRNATGHLRKLMSKTHQADMAWVFRHFFENEGKNFFSNYRTNGFCRRISQRTLTFFMHSEAPQLSLVVGLSIFICMVMAATIGSFNLLVLKCFDIDADIANGPFVTTPIDILGVCVYFWIAKLFLEL